MQILFVWVEEYANIHNQGFNFSSEYDISYDINKNELEISKNESFIENLFGEEFSNITAIVGQNGSGKTSVLEFKNLGFYFILKDDKFILVHLDKKYEKIKISGTEKMEIFDKEESEKVLKESLFIKYSPVFEAIKDPDLNYKPKYEKYFYSPFYCVDLTTDYLLVSNDFSNPQSDIGTLSNYRLHETFIQAEFLFANLKELPFNLPNELTISNLIEREYQQFGKIIDEYRLDHINQIELSKNPEKNISTYHDKQNSSFRILHTYQNIKLSEDLLQNLKTNLENIHKEIISSNNNILLKEEKKVEMAISQLMWTGFLNFFNLYPGQAGYISVPYINEINKFIPQAPIISWFKMFFNEGINYISENSESKFTNEIKAWKNFYLMIEEIEILLKKGIIRISYSENNRLYLDPTLSKIKFWDCQFCLDLNITENYIFYKKALFENYKEVIRKHRYDSLGFLNYEFRRISSGERAFLSQFSRIFSISRFAKSEKIKNVILFIDEGELGMHPQWQKEYLKTLITTLPIIFKDSEINSIQLIMATHSPLVISDLPVSNIVFLSKNLNGDCQVLVNPLSDKKPTFASNIHSLFADSFFINDGLIGDFAKLKINDVIKDLLSQSKLDANRKNQIKKIIQAVGEPIIRKKLMQLFNDQYNLEIDDRIALLETEINKLKKEKK